MLTQLPLIVEGIQCALITLGLLSVWFTRDHAQQLFLAWTLNLDALYYVFCIFVSNIPALFITFYWYELTVLKVTLSALFFIGLRNLILDLHRLGFQPFFQRPESMIYILLVLSPFFFYLLGLNVYFSPWAVFGEISFLSRFLFSLYRFFLNILFILFVHILFFLRYRPRATTAASSDNPFAGIVYSTQQNSIDVILNDEVGKYLLDGEQHTTSITGYWKNATHYPYLASSAKHILSIPASSCPLERSFSVLNKVDSKERPQ
uniref:HAT C-terminal dimerisation domain-containing protein n=1 Tax=Panagrolaimus davidi TaxID=227884 RepID=A0A914QMG4_9BILA